MSSNEKESNGTKKKKIVVLGGGAGSLSAVFYLTQDKNWKEKFESITVYQMGWRLGGKGASGRNKDQSNRIEEHGVHLFFGCYENAFRLMRDCYKALNRPKGSVMCTAFPSPEGRGAMPQDIPESAFRAQDQVVLMDEHGGAENPWVFDFPPNERLPGSGNKTEPDFMTVMVRLMRAISGDSKHFRKNIPVTESSSVDDSPWNINGKFDGTPPYKLGVDRNILTDAYRRPATTLNELKDKPLLDAAIDVIEKTKNSAHEEDLREFVRETLEEHERRIDHFERGDLCKPFEGGSLLMADLAPKLEKSRRKTIITQRLILTVAKGILNERVFENGLDQLDDIEFTDWLKKYGLTDPDYWWSPIVRGLYEMVFGFRVERDPGDGVVPNLSAAVALRGIIRFFGDYDGSFIWEMTSGMGDTIFAPLYEVLRKRGVQFRFFHRIDELVLNEDATKVSEIRLSRQIREMASLSYDLELLPEAELYDIPDCGEKKVFVAWIEKRYYFRVFDSFGNIVGDCNDKKVDRLLIDQLLALIPPHGEIPTEVEKQKIIGHVFSIVGHRDIYDYEPLVRVNLKDGHHMDCWPNQPDYAQLNQDQAERLKKLYEDSCGTVDLESAQFDWDGDDVLKPRELPSLKDGQDFDEVIIGVGLGMIPSLIKEGKASPKSSYKGTWKDLLTVLKPIKTKGAQLWLKENPECHDWVPRRSAFGDKWPSWIGMTHVKGTECWSEENQIKHIAYLFAQVTEPHNSNPGDTKSPGAAKEEVKDEIVRFLNEDVEKLWGPNSGIIADHKFKWSSLHDSAGQEGEACMNSQYWRINSNPSDLYVPAPPNTVEMRPEPENCGLTNGYVATDWARNGFNCGCVESAVMSGMRVARNLCGAPERIYWTNRDFEIREPQFQIKKGPGNAACGPGDVTNIKETRAQFIEAYRDYLRFEGGPPKGLWPFLITVDIKGKSSPNPRDKVALKSKEEEFYKCFSSMKVLESQVWREEFEKGFADAKGDIKDSDPVPRKIRIIFKRLLNSLDRTLYETRELSCTSPKVFTSYVEERKTFISGITPYLEEGCENGTIPARPLPEFFQKFVLGGQTLQELIRTLNASKNLDISFANPSAGPVSLYAEALWYAFLFVFNFNRVDDSDCLQDSDQLVDEVVDLYFQVIGKTPADSAKKLAEIMTQRVTGPVQLTWRGDFKATVMSFPFPKSEVKKLLPLMGVELEDNGFYDDPYYHPIIVMAGTQTNVRPDPSLTDLSHGGVEATKCQFNEKEYGISETEKYLRFEREHELRDSTRNPSLVYSYLETFVLIPFVRKNGCTYCFSTVLYLDRKLPIEIGNLIGLPKTDGTFVISEQSYRVMNEEGSLLEVEGIKRGTPTRPGSIANFERFRSIFKMPHLAKFPGTDVFTKCGTRADITNHGFIPERVEPTITPVTCSATTQAKLCSVFGGSPSKFNPLDVDPYGAFEINATWIIPPSERVD